MILGAAEAHLLGWCCFTDNTYLLPRHIRFISDHLMKVESGEIKRLIITVPPRAGKSNLATIKFPSWFLGRNPNKRIIIAAYGDSLAWNFSRLARNDFKDFGEDVFGLKLAVDSKAINSWSIKGHKGGLVAAGVGGPLTGKGGDVILVDDPVKDQVEANSKLIRDRKWDWYTQVARTRLHPGGAIIVIQCMTGDTRVLMSDGNEKLLKDINIGDRVATYKNGEITESKINNWKNQGLDDVFEVEMESGKTFKANERHPFLMERGDKKEWVRIQGMREGDLILSVLKLNSLNHLNTYKITKERVISIKKKGREDVFDIEVDKTENFIANGFISHNTRWHQDDLTGRIIENDPKGWTILNLPAIAEENDPLGRVQGEALWPERFPIEDLEAIRKDIGDYAFSALYQQRPAPPSGAIIKRDWIKYYDEMPESFDKVIQTWDLSTKSTDNSSFVVGQVWGKKGPDRYLLDQYRARTGFMESIKAIKFMRNKWKDSKSIYIEEKANGPAVIQVLKKEIEGVISFNPKTSKEDRLRSCEPLFQAGNILLPHSSIANWVMDLVYEITTFPFSQNDDQADCLSMAQDRLTESFDYSNLNINASSGELTPSFSGYNYGKI